METEVNSPLKLKGNGRIQIDTKIWDMVGLNFWKKKTIWLYMPGSDGYEDVLSICLITYL